MELVDKIYAATTTFPENEKYGLKSQLRRASVSIPSQIAEGAAQPTTKSYLHYLYLARGSLYEIRTQFYICRNQQFITEKNAYHLWQLIKRLTAALHAQIKALKQKTD